MRVITDNRRLSRRTLTILASVGWAALLYLAWVVGQDSLERTRWSLEILGGGPTATDPFNQRYADHPVMTLFHTVPGLLFVTLGPLQFMGFVRRRLPVIHRASGRIFVVIGVTSGIAAFLMSVRFPMWGMSLNTLISAGFALFMTFAFINAFRHVKGRRFHLHREWMIRGFAAGMSVAFFRVMLDDVLPRMGVESFDTRWNTVVVISFPIVLGIGELWIRATRKSGGAREEAAPAQA